MRVEESVCGQGEAFSVSLNTSLSNKTYHSGRDLSGVCFLLDIVIRCGNIQASVRMCQQEDLSGFRDRVLY